AIQTGGGIVNIAGSGAGGGVLTLRNNAQWALPAPGFSANQVFLTSIGAGSTLNLQSGSDLVHTGSELRVGISGQRGTLSIDGGSTLTTNAALNMGGTGSSISVTGGSSLTTSTMNIAGNTGDAVSFTVSGTGSLLSTSGLIRFGHNLTGGGGECQLSLTGGAVLTSTFVDATQGSIRFRRVNGAGGSLTMSQATINAADDVEYSNAVTPLTMTASTINAPRLTLNGATLTGDGTINADIINSGQVQPTGTGFTLLGTLNDNGTGVAGSRLTFGNGSSYTGDGILSCEVQTLPGSAITPSGNLLLGNPASVNGVAIGGTLNVGPHVVELRDFNGAIISGTVNLAGGTLFNPSSVLFGGGTSTTLEGHGIVVGQSRVRDARLQPGQPDGDRTGHIAFDSLNFDNTGIFSIDIEGEAPGQFDSVSSGDEVELNGLRVTVTLVGAYAPAIGTRFRVLTGSIVDDQVQLIDSPGFALELVPGAMDAVFVGACDPVDFNGDGLFPDTADIDDFLSVFSGGPCGTGTCNDVDFNNDGLFPDTTDIDALLSVFSGGPCF
ncbi:MAG TPA: hypothetical protein VHN77_15080, partial [Phycisphaerales bacterium]|nr:hypothetical protein [Phycisphaerales bacterium]